MIILFDSNIWLSELGLRSGIGAAVRFYLKQTAARVAIPEVVSLEVAENLRRLLVQHVERIRSEHRQLLTVFGTLPEIVLPTQEQIEARIESLFASIEVEQIEIPLSLESARSSFLKTINKAPPSHQSQQFKDGVLWADCLDLLATDSVVLVTTDKAFYEGQQYEKGLARNLRDEAASRRNAVRILDKLSDLLESVRTPIAVDEDELQSAFFEAHGASLQGTLEEHGFALGSRTELSFNLFATDNPAVLFIDFTMAIQCTDSRGEGRTEAVLRLQGDGEYLPATREFRNLRNFGEQLQFRLADGNLGEVRNVVVHLEGIVIGHRQVSHVIRHPLT